MSQDSKSVYEAIERWEQGSLISPDVAERLREEVSRSASAGTVRFTQYVLAGTAAVVLLMAAAVFLDWAWPQMADSARTGLIFLTGVGVHVWGVSLEGRRRWVPAALLMQTAGLALVLTAFVYSKEAWADVSAGGVMVGVMALATPIIAAPRAFRRNAVMPAVHVCFGLGFLAVFLNRATPLDDDSIIWVLDGVLFIAAIVMQRILRWDPAGERHPWALNAFVAAIYAGFFLTAITASGPLNLGEDTVYPLDVWLALVAALTLWGIHRAPPGLRRDWFEAQLAYTVALWIPLGMFTSIEALRWPAEAVLAFVGGVGIAAFAYAVRFRTRRVLTMGALTFIVALWYWATERAGAIGAVLALGVTAALLFRVSARAASWSASQGED